MSGDMYYMEGGKKQDSAIHDTMLDNAEADKLSAKQSIKFLIDELGYSESEARGLIEGGDLGKDAALIRAAGVMFMCKCSNREPSILWIKRSADGDHPGEWCFPGGVIKSGETAVQAAKRECDEEINCIPEGELIEFAKEINSEEGVEFTTFVNVVVGEFQPVLNNESMAWAWAPLSAPPEPLLPAIKALLQDVAYDEPFALDAKKELTGGHWITTEKDHHVYVKQGKVVTKDIEKQLDPISAIEDALDAEFKESEHPRGQPDNAGQFGPGGGGKANKASSSSEMETSPISGQGLHIDVAHPIARKVCSELNFPIDRVAFPNKPRLVEINNRKFYAAGDANIYDLEYGNINLYLDQLSKESVKGVLTHEIAHMKFAEKLKKISELKKTIADIEPPNGTDYFKTVMMANGELREPYASQYPEYNEWHRIFDSKSIGEDFAKTDGVSDYSKAYWDEWHEGKMSTELAMHETLAEMSRIKYETGKFPEHQFSGPLPRHNKSAEYPEGFATTKGIDKIIREGAKTWRALYKAVGL